jgi:hypothetical protein
VHRTAQTIAESQASKPENQSDEKPKFKRGSHPKSLANLVAPWTPETRPQSPGRPRDVAGEISRAAIENNREAIYQAVTEKLLAGDAYAFSVHSDRGYGKLKQGIIHQGDEDGGPVKTHITVEFVEPKP